MIISHFGRNVHNILQRAQGRKQFHLGLASCVAEKALGVMEPRDDGTVVTVLNNQSQRVQQEGKKEAEGKKHGNDGSGVTIASVIDTNECRIRRRGRWKSLSA